SKTQTANNTHALAGGKIQPLPPFVLPGYLWMPTWWEPKPKPSEVFHSIGNAVLVRDGGQGEEYFSEPSEDVKAICLWSRKRQEAEITRFFDSDRAPTANLFVRAKEVKSKGATQSLAWKAEALLRRLIQLSHEGNERAASCVAQITMTGCAELSRLAKENPKLLHPVARKCWKWPVAMSPHPLLTEDYKSICRSLKLGEDTPFEIHRTARWKLDEFGKTAVALLVYLWRARSENRFPATDCGELGKVMDSLPPFSNDSAPQWWEVAKKILELHCPDLVKIPELVALVKARTRNKSPGRTRSYILRKLRERFVGVARPNLPCPV
ncbi:MAG: hypothetical protein WA117_21310, partial [Verrucomicrobiia bacterium]